MLPVILAGLVLGITAIGIPASHGQALGVDDKTLRSIAAKHGQAAVQRINDWQTLIANNQHLAEAEKLRLVNRFFNRMDFVSDPMHWGQEDYWATPMEFLATNGGDCEDFSVAKYFTLEALGVPMERLYLTYVKALTPNPVNQAHMVLAYYKTPDAEPVILDNLVPDIRPASARRDLIPVYSFNGKGLWLAKQRGRGQLVGDAARLSRWTDLLQRMK